MHVSSSKKWMMAWCSSSCCWPRACCSRYGSAETTAGDAALAVMLRERTEVLLVSNDPLHLMHVGRIIDFMAKNRIAGMFQSKESVAAGGLMAYGASMPDLFRRAAFYAHRILQGAKPADLPVELPTKFDLAINLKTARALGLDLPSLLVARADEVIE